MEAVAVGRVDEHQTNLETIMTMISNLLRSTALTAAFGVSLSAGPALAQESQSQPQAQQGTSSSQQAQDNRKVATVNGNEIVADDVRQFVDTLPDQLRRSQPPEMILSTAVQQLVMRELILEQARNANLSEDQRVKDLVAQTTQDAQDDAMVQVWLEQKFAEDITDEAVQGAYDALRATSAQELPPLEQVRPQIEQQLRQQAYADLRGELQQGADIVFYDATGNPMDEQSGANESSSDARSSQGSTSGSTSADSNTSNGETSASGQNSGNGAPDGDTSSGSESESTSSGSGNNSTSSATGSSGTSSGSSN